MRIIHRGGALLVGLMLALVMFIGGARANVVYDWTGTCTSGCTGTATGVLTLADTYTPGTAFSLADLINWEYTSSTGSFTVPGDTILFNAGGVLPNGTSSRLNMFLDFALGGTSFQTANLPTWIFRYDSNGIFDNGRSYEWALRVNPVPLPATAWMFLSTLLAAGLFGWWRRRRRVGAMATA